MCFTIAEIIAMEDLGFVKRGEGGPYTAAGHTALRGELPINTSGGLKSEASPGRRHGRGAQICDLVRADLAAKRVSGRSRAIRWAWRKIWADRARRAWSASWGGM